MAKIKVKSITAKEFKAIRDEHAKKVSKQISDSLKEHQKKLSAMQETMNALKAAQPAPATKVRERKKLPKPKNK